MRNGDIDGADILCAYVHIKVLNLCNVLYIVGCIVSALLLVCSGKDVHDFMIIAVFESVHKCTTWIQLVYCLIKVSCLSYILCKVNKRPMRRVSENKSIVCKMLGLFVVEMMFAIVITKRKAIDQYSNILISLFYYLMQLVDLVALALIIVGYIIYYNKNKDAKSRMFIRI